MHQSVRLEQPLSKSKSQIKRETCFEIILNVFNARYEGKENSMEFINSWLDEESGNMRKFLDLVSGPPPEDWIHGLGEQGAGARPGALGRHLSSLHTVLVENVGKVGTIQSLQKLS